MDERVKNSLYQLCSKYGYEFYQWGCIDTPEYSICHGVSRLCVVFKKLPFVAKVALDEESEDEENELERLRYLAAENWGVEKYFARPLKTISIGSVKWTIFEKVPYVGRLDLLTDYIVEKPIPDWFYSSDYGRLEYEECDDWVFYAMEDADFEQLVEFLGKEEIVDLHQLNFGYSNGHIVFVDYAGQK